MRLDPVRRWGNSNHGRKDTPMLHQHQALLVISVEGQDEAGRREADEYAARAAWSVARRWRGVVRRVRAAFRTSHGVVLPAPRSARP
jgi:hypothetical protein